MGDLDFFCPLFVTTFDIFLICNVCCFAPYKTIVSLIKKTLHYEQWKEGNHQRDTDEQIWCEGE